MDMIAYQYTWSRLELHKLSLHKAPDVAHAKAGSAAFAGASGHLRVINGQNCPAKAPASRWKLWTMRSLTRSKVPRISQDLIILGYSGSSDFKMFEGWNTGKDWIRYDSIGMRLWHVVTCCDMLWHVVTLQSQAMKAFCLAISCHAEAFAERSSRLASWVWRG
jgi:hypothetical protein